MIPPHRLASALVILLFALPPLRADEAFRVLTNDESPSPADNAGNVGLQAPIRVLFSRPMDPRRFDSAAMRLLNENGDAVPALLQTDLTGGVATLTPTLAMQPGQTYRLELTARLRTADGQPLRPFSSSFTTTADKPRPDPRFVCLRQKIADRDHNTCLSVGPDGNLYVADAFGELRRYLLDERTGLPLNHEDVPYRADGDQIIGMAWDPEATADNLVLWISYGQYHQQYGGCIARLELPPFEMRDAGAGIRESTGDSDARATHCASRIATKQDYIVGLPHDVLLHHQPNGIAFGPDGKLYQSIGGVTTLGGNPNWGMNETPLSAAMIVADVRHPDFGGGQLPVNVQTSAPVGYDPQADDAPVRVFATGFRNAVDLCWHSSGHLFTATNQNSIKGGVHTPASPDGRVPAIIATPHEMLYRVEEGHYYGHPNPARGEYVLNGGNPTEQLDPFEVNEYPVGIQPHEGFDPSLIYDLRPGGGNSANGMCEYIGENDLHQRLLIAYFGGGACIQTFAVDADGRVTHEHPLIDVDGNPHRFQGAIDVASSSATGVIYVAAFGKWERPNFGLGGSIWLLVPPRRDISITPAVDRQNVVPRDAP